MGVTQNRELVLNQWMIDDGQVGVGIAFGLGAVLFTAAVVRFFAGFFSLTASTSASPLYTPAVTVR